MPDIDRDKKASPGKNGSLYGLWSAFKLAEFLGFSTVVMADAASLNVTSLFTASEDLTQPKGSFGRNSVTAPHVRREGMPVKLDA